MDVSQVRENRRAWNQIATSFDATRNQAWPTVLRFLADLARPGRLLDVGAGNGRHSVPAATAGHRVVAFDLARPLLRAARDRSGGVPLDVVEGAMERLPFRDHTFDAAIAVAVLHHVRGRVERDAALAECLRVLRPGGQLLVSAWSRRQPRFGPGREPRPPDDGRPVEEGDAWVRWTHHRLDVDRFVHLFDWDEWNAFAKHGPLVRTWSEAIMTRDEPDNYFALFQTRGGQGGANDLAGPNRAR